MGHLLRPFHLFTETNTLAVALEHISVVFFLCTNGIISHLNDNDDDDCDTKVSALQKREFLGHLQHTRSGEMGEV